MQGLKGDATYLVVTDQGEIEKYGINGVALHPALSSGNAMAALFQSRILHLGIQQWRHRNCSLLLSFSGCCSMQALSTRSCLADSASDMVRLCSCLHALGMRRAME